MSGKAIHISPLFMALIVTGCAVDKPQPFPSQAPIQALSGVIVERQEQLWFQPCHEKLWWPLQDFTPQQELTGYYQRFTQFSHKDLYVELQGAVDSALDNALLVKRVDTVGGTAATCHFRLDDILFRAASSEPHWVADIFADHVLVKSINPLGRFNFKVTDTPADTDSVDIMFADKAEANSTDTVVAHYRERREGDRQHFQSSSRKAPFDITIIEKRCIDTESGTLLPLTAQMTFFGKSYEGCARQGRPAITELAGFYWYQPANGHQVMFKLSKDHRVQLVSRDSSGKAVTEHGQWQYLQSGKLIFSMRDAQQQEYLMLFRRASSGQLVLQTGSDRLAALGATFQLWQPSGLSGGQPLPGSVKPAPQPRSMTRPASVADTPSPAQETLQKPLQKSLQKPLSTQPAASTSSLLTDAVFNDLPVQAADIDDELLNEIIVDDANH
ncbi:hypothetical protein EH243_07270 [Amphritea opalescens]|uniref:Uncharacterized protein n=1 Tax=Amphritea opalescens TaxID=2490544 RepID=A0A430KSE8_9GAMM|nr:hypothetical protein [Amphritea opalescens]RTE66388.1 hypothetical protein EH243_07270 [Amphritea opalescens]